MNKFYLVKGFYKGEGFFYETTPERAGREDILRLMASGEYEPGPIIQVVEVDLDNHTSKDVSTEFADALVEEAKDDTPFPPGVAEFVRNNRTPYRRSA